MKYVATHACIVWVYNVSCRTSREEISVPHVDIEIFLILIRVLLLPTVLCTSSKVDFHVKYVENCEKIRFCEIFTYALYKDSELIVNRSEDAPSLTILWL